MEHLWDQVEHQLHHRLSSVADLTNPFVYVIIPTNTFQQESIPKRVVVIVTAKWGVHLEWDVQNIHLVYDDNQELLNV